MVLDRWYPERAPTWADVFVVGLALVVPSRHLIRTDPILWRWVAIGFLLGLGSLGPLANSAIGLQAGSWFRKIGGAGRIATTALAALVVAVTMYQFDILTAVVASFGVGVIASVLVYATMYVARAGEIDGWY
ncbi:hypothetical protein [Natronococcus occultus]|uniref:Uncharacterized protein n=1 Tax=Natronococcus occultus SP4 TaxID=694430 RepID=L0JYK6_9EURY|nr:hypothetical protein [Natronococcus occultus]AGB38137.1 hypothetical protein Natoc_2361 [Natronococcus occultus SP4]